MNILRTKNLYLQACQQAEDVHAMTDEERTRLQRHLFKMYKEIEAVCVKHNLTVMLAYGSVLGAVRHGGFIPWDDDVDVFMPRKDYELLINRYADELPDYLKIYAPNSRLKALSRFAKIVDVRTRFISATSEDRGDPSQGIFLDIFPIEYVSDKPLAIKVKRFMSMGLMYIGTSVGQYRSKNSRYRKLMSTSTPAKVNYWLRNCLGFCFSFFNYQQWMNITDKYCRGSKETNSMGDIVGFSRWKPLPKEVYLPAIEGTFDGEKVFLPHNPVAHLVATYGNWQRIPPPEERWQHFIRYIVFPEDNQQPVNS